MDTRPPGPADPARRPQLGDDEQPPSLPGGWRTLYAVVIGELLLVIAFCYWLTGRGR